MNIFSKNLKRFRVAKNMTQEQAAEALGVSSQSVSRWECSTTLPDVTILPKIAALYCITIDDLYKENSVAYDNYAQRLGSVFEASLKPEDFLRADMEYRKMLKSGEYTTEDLRLYGILHQQMMQVCMKRAEELYDQVISKGVQEDYDVYWSVRRQKEYLLWRIGRNQESIEEYLTLVKGGCQDLHAWICLIQGYTFAEEYENAIKWAGQAEERFPESAMLHIAIGDLYRSMKRYEEAFPHWKRALEMEPDWLDSAYSMAVCYEEMGNLQKAYEMYAQIADNLERRGFDAEGNWPRTRAFMCRERTTI